MAQLKQRCPHVGAANIHVNKLQHHDTRPRLLRVPKSASTTFSSFAEGCNELLRDPHLFFQHEAPPSDSCREASVATLREPCERFVSMYRQLETNFAYDTPLCRYYKRECHMHFVHLASNVSDFVRLVRARWLSLLGTPSISLDTMPPRGIGTSLLLKHGILAVPQALWIGNYSVVLCVPSLTEEMARLHRELHCRGQTPASRAASNQTWLNVHAATDGTASSRYTLSLAACAEVRKLYHQDTMLWERLCAAQPHARVSRG